MCCNKLVKLALSYSTHHDKHFDLKHFDDGSHDKEVKVFYGLVTFLHL